MWKDIAAQIKNLVVKVCHVDAHVPKSWATEEQQNNHQVDQAARIKVAQIDLDWQHKSELFLARWAHETLGQQDKSCFLCFENNNNKKNNISKRRRLTLTHSPLIYFLVHLSD